MRDDGELGKRGRCSNDDLAYTGTGLNWAGGDWSWQAMGTGVRETPRSDPRTEDPDMRARGWLCIDTLTQVMQLRQSAEARSLPRTAPLTWPDMHAGAPDESPPPRWFFAHQSNWETIVLDISGPGRRGTHHNDDDGRRTTLKPLTLIFFPSAPAPHWYFPPISDISLICLLLFHCYPLEWCFSPLCFLFLSLLLLFLMRGCQACN